MKMMKICDTTVIRKSLRTDNIHGTRFKILMEIMRKVELLKNCWVCVCMCVCVLAFMERGCQVCS